MGVKNQNTLQFNWQSSSPVPFVPNTALSGVTSGVMADASTIYSNIIDVTLKDNLGLEFTWTGTPTGTFTVYGSSSGINFYTVPVITSNPTGGAGGFLLDLVQWPWKYIYIKYVNSGGSGLLNVYMTTKDLN